MTTSDWPVYPTNPINIYEERIGPVPDGIVRRLSAIRLMKPLYAALERAVADQQPITDWSALVSQLLVQSSEPAPSGPPSPEASTPTPSASAPD